MIDVTLANSQKSKLGVSIGYRIPFPNMIGDPVEVGDGVHLRGLLLPVCEDML